MANIYDLFEALSDQALYAIAKDIDIEAQEHDLNDYDRLDLMGVIEDWVEDGVTAGNWTLEEWISQIKDSHYVNI